MVVNRQRRVRVDVPPLTAFLGRVRRLAPLREMRGCELTVALVSDAEIARLNAQFRGQAGPTDVLSFPADGSHSTRGPSRSDRVGAGPRLPRSRYSGTRGARPPVYLGDIAISPETARRNAKRFGRTLSNELRILILHGVLHLLGYDHEADSARREEMERLERRLRRTLELE